MYVYVCEECVCLCVREKKSEKESTLVNISACVCTLYVSCFVCVCMYEFLACQYEMCVSHVEQDSRSLRPGPCLGSQPRVM